MIRPGLVATLALGAFGCRAEPRRAVAVRAPDAEASVGASPWRVTPVGGVAVRVETGKFLVGAMRVTEGAVGAGALPATALAACARTSDGWRFVSEDGTLYAAPSFTGTMLVVGALPTRVVAPRADALRGVHSEGMLAVIDPEARLWLVDRHGPRRLPMASVVSAAALSARDVLAVVEPGVLRVSRDGGGTFRSAGVPAGVAVGVSVRDGDAVVQTTAGAYRWRDGQLEVIPAGPTTERWMAAGAWVADRVSEVTSRWLPDTASAVASRGTDGFVVVREGWLVTVDARTGAERSRVRAPGERCELHSSGAGLRAVCVHGGWARAVFAEDSAAPTGWRVLRDELAAEPMGAAVFDRTTGAWAVQAPCTQRPTPDPRAVCVYDARGQKHPQTLPWEGALRDMDGGRALALSGRSVAVVTEDSVVAGEVPGVAGALAGGWLSGDAVAVWWAAGGAVSLARGRPGADGGAWRTVRSQPGARVAVRAQDAALLVGDAADALWRVSLRGEALPWARVVSGAGAALALGDVAGSYCVGGWCRLGATLTLTPAATNEPVIAREALAPAVEARTTPRAIRCVLGQRAPSVEIDHGVAASGYAMAWSVDGERVRVRWAGERVRGEAIGELALRSGAAVRGLGVMGATRPAGLLERCDARGCDHRLVTADGTVALGLGRARGGGVELLQRGDGYVVRMEDVFDATGLVTLVGLDARGAEQWRRSFVSARGTGFAHAGSLGPDDGLWVEGADGQTRFYGVTAGDREGTPRAVVASLDGRTEPCGAEAGRGVMQRVTRVSQVMGDGWFVEAGEWQQEERLRVVGDRLCVERISAGESRDEDEARAAGAEEREPVRSFVIDGAGAAGYVGSAWAGRTRAALRCAEVAP